MKCVEVRVCIAYVKQFKYFSGNETIWCDFYARN